MNNNIINHPVIAMDSVVSSQISAIGHDSETQILAVQFPPNKHGLSSIYHYANFSEEDFAAFKVAESKGSYFGKFIKNRSDKYPYQRIQ